MFVRFVWDVSKRLARNGAGSTTRRRRSGAMIDPLLDARRGSPRRGLLLSCLVLWLGYSFSTSDEWRATAWAALCTAALLALCVPSLWATFALLHQYIATLSLRPNARLVDWTYLALLQGLLAAAAAWVCGACCAWTLPGAWPLFGAALEGIPPPNVTLPVVGWAEVPLVPPDGVRLPAWVPAANVTLPASVSWTHGELHLRWWSAGAAIGALAGGLFLAQRLVAFVAMGCGGGPAIWRRHPPRQGGCRPTSLEASAAALLPRVGATPAASARRSSTCWPNTWQASAARRRTATRSACRCTPRGASPTRSSRLRLGAWRRRERPTASRRAASCSSTVPPAEGVRGKAGMPTARP